MIEVFLFLFGLLSAIGIVLVFCLFLVWVFLREFNVANTTSRDFFTWKLKEGSDGDN